jgi:hypothetical protein
MPGWCFKVSGVLELADKKYSQNKPRDGPSSNPALTGASEN